MTAPNQVPERTPVEDSISWLLERLPEKSIRPPEELNQSECSMNGADRVIAKLIGLEKAPECYAHWYHGWPACKFYFDSRFPRKPETYAYWMKKDPSSTQWPVLVAGEREYQYLRDLGVDKVCLAGLPFIYAESDPVDRAEGSLLVCPTHEAFKDDEKRLRMERDYIAEVIKLKDRFTTLVACVHSACFDTGRWVHSFREAGIPVVRGADASDRNCFARMRAIFGSFEFMTTHVVSSHVAFAGYCGCKVSFYGPQPPTALEDFSVYFSNRDEAQAFFSVTSEFNRRENLSREFPFLFNEPHKAESCLDWASDALGLQYKRDPFEIARLLGWTYDPEKYPEMKAKGGFDYWFPKLGVAPEARHLEKKYAEERETLTAKINNTENELNIQTARSGQLEVELAGCRSTINEQSGVIASLRQEIKDSKKQHKKQCEELAKKANVLEKTVRSAVEWQRRSIFTRAFHRWRPK